MAGPIPHIHSPAQAICFFAREGAAYHELTDRVVRWLLQHLYSGRGFFYFRRGRFFTNRIRYMRWSQAWAFHALTEYVLARSQSESGGFAASSVALERKPPPSYAIHCLHIAHRRHASLRARDLKPAPLDHLLSPLDAQI